MVGRFGGQLFSRMILLIHLWTAVWKLKVLLWAPVKVWFYSVQGSYFILSRMGNKMIYQLDDLIKKTSWKSSRLIYKCSNFALFCCQVSSLSRPRHRALIEGVIFGSVLMQYMLFSSGTEKADMWCQKTSERVSVFTHTKKASRLRDCGIPKAHFSARWDFTIDRPFSQ